MPSRSEAAGRAPFRAMARRLLFFFFPALAAATFLLPFVPGGARAQLAERVGSAEAPIYEDNLDSAKKSAVYLAQRNAIRRMLEEMVVPEWVALFDTEIRKQVLHRPGRYISAYRVRRLEASLDRTRYFATLAAQVNRDLLVRDLHALSLPVKGDAKKRVLIAYPATDPVLGKASLRGPAMKILKARLTLLNFQITGSVPLSQQEAERLANPFGDAAARGEWLSRRKVAAGFFVAFDRGESRDAGGVSAHLFQSGNGATLGSFSARSANTAVGGGRPASGGSTARLARLARLVTPLAQQLQPGGIKPFGAGGGQTAPLKLRVLGFASVEDEENFARVFFGRDSQFAGFVLTRLDGESVTFRGTYTGDRRALEVELPGKKFGEFLVTSVFWFNDVLEIAVKKTGARRFIEMKLFPEELRTKPVAEAIRKYLEKYPEFQLESPTYSEVEDNGWLNRANTLPFNVTAYGFVDSRRDSDFFVAEELKEGEEIQISWHRVGRTNLTPVLRIYDEKGFPVRFYHPRFRIKTKYKVPKGQHGFYVEVTDRFGGIRWDAGGYLSFSYLLLLERAAGD